MADPNKKNTFRYKPATVKVESVTPAQRASALINLYFKFGLPAEGGNPENPDPAMPAMLSVRTRGGSKKTNTPPRLP
jgi:hypothetical protein